ncbi:Pfam:DUF2360 [Paramecium bursaria]
MENNIDLTKLEPIPYRNTIAILNEYVIQNIDFLNKFGHFNENKLFDMEIVLDEIESKVLLLEKKLDSVQPELYQGLVLPQPGQSIIQHNQQAPSLDPAPQQPISTPSQPQQQQQQFEPAQPAQQQQDQPVEEQPPVEEPPQIDERLQKYIKLLSYGVPVVQLKIKMGLEGLDPNSIDQYVN